MARFLKIKSSRAENMKTSRIFTGFFALVVVGVVGLAPGCSGGRHVTPDTAQPEPNPCVTCTTNADCFGGLVCADALNTWDNPATPNICTQPCWGNGVCPSGMFCDFSVSKYCQCNQPSIDLSLHKTVSNATPNPGDTIMYSVTITNNSTSTATGIQVVDVLPAGVTFASFGGASFGTFDIMTHTWTIPSIPPYTYGNMVLYVTVDANANGAIVNTAEIMVAGQPDPDSTPGNHVTTEDDIASVTITVHQPDPCHDLVVYSDITSTVDGTTTPAVEVTPASASWNPATVGIPGAMWIWVTNPAQNPATETHVFTRTFTWNHPVGAAVLKIASDNKYSVIINGFSVNETGAGLVDTTPNGTTFQHPVTYHVANTILASANSIDVSVTNNNKANAWNPAGLRYELTVYCKPANPCQKCETDADCGGGLACLDDDGVAITSKVCTSTCDAFAVNPGCAEGQTCDAATGICQCDRCNAAWNPQCVATNCETPDGQLGACHPTADGCQCSLPNFCQTCTTDADCLGGLVCADAYDTWDDPSAPHICTQPCWATGICPAGMICDFNVSKYCECQLCTPPPPQMIAWWPLDEVAGPTAVDVVNGVNGTWVNGPTPVAGMVAGALQMNGGYVRVPNSSVLDLGTGNFTIDAWIKYDSNPPTSAQDTIVRFGFTQLDILWWSNQFEAWIPGTNSIYQVPIAGGADQWHLVAVAVDRADPLGVKLYVDGALLGSYSPATLISLSTTDDLLIGMDATLAWPYYGAIDEVEFFKRALAPGEIKKIFAAGGAGKCKNDTCAPDVTPPVLSCPGPVSIMGNWPACKAKPLPATAVDNCDSAPVVIAAPSSFVGQGTYLVTYTATDASGNTSTCQSEVTILCDPCADPANEKCEPKDCKLPDGTAGKCELGAAGCGCQSVVVPTNPCQKCETDADCTGGLVCFDEDANAATPKVCTTVYTPTVGCPAGMHGDYNISKYCICEDCGSVFNPKCEAQTCVVATAAGSTVGQCKLTGDKCDCQPSQPVQNFCAKCDNDSSCTGGLVCFDEDNNPATPNVCTKVYDPAVGCPAGMHGDYSISKYCICEDCGSVLNPKCDSLECVTLKGEVGKCTLGAAGCECAF
jgi:uncharacterized repeat protein (TIGR01451 family)